MNLKKHMSLVTYLLNNAFLIFEIFSAFARIVFTTSTPSLRAPKIHVYKVSYCVKMCHYSILLCLNNRPKGLPKDLGIFSLTDSSVG